MTASIPVFSPMVRVTDANGNPVSNGTVEFYNAGTSTPKTVYADKELSTSLGTTVSTDSGGYPITSGNARTLVYTGTDAFKMIVKDSSGSTLVTHDSVPGAVIVPDAASSALAKVPVVSETSNRTGAASDRGKLIAFNTTSGARAYTLPSAIDVDDDWLVHLCVGAGTNTLIYRTTGSDTVIQAGGKSVTAAVVSGVVTIVCDGAGFRELSATESNRLPRTPFITVADRLTATPSSPTPGALYIITGSPTGAWSTLGFTTGQIAEANGNGSWTSRTPAEGWLAHVADEGVLTQYRSSAWTDLTNVTAPTSSTLECAVFEHQENNGTVGGTATTAAWTKRTLNTSVKNTITDCSLATSQITLPVGTYLINFWQSLHASTGSQSRIKVVSGTATPDLIPHGYYVPYATDSGGDNPLTIVAPPSSSGILTVTATAVIELQYWVASTAGGTSALGAVSAEPAGSNEVYARVTILDLTALQGPTGAQGTQGTDGLDAAYPYQWSTSTSGDPGSGKVAVNNADPTLATVLRVNQTDASGGVLTNVIATWDDSTSNVRARVKISKEGATQHFYAYSITGAATDQGDYWDFPVSFLGPASGTTLSSSDSVALLVIEKGDKGDTGATGASGSAGATGATGATGPNTGHDYAFDTDTADSDQGAGKFWLNHATPGSATWAYISKTDRNGNDLGTEIGGWDDSDNTAHRLTLRVWDVATPTKGFTIEVTGTFTDATTYWKIPISSIAARVSGAPAAAAVLAVMPHRTGNKGADGAGSFTSLSPGAGTTSNTASAAPGSAITTSGTLSAAELVNAQTGTTYTVVNGDRAKLVTLSNASSIAVTLPQAGASSEFQSGWFADFFAKGAGTVTVTPTTSTINGAASLTIPSGRGCRIVSDGTNYQVSTKPLVAGTDYQAPVTAALLAAFAFGPFTTIASATTTDLSTVATVGVSISGTTTITGFGTGANLLRIGKFAGALTLTHNATSLILPGGANITTAAGDRFIALSDGSGNWTVIDYVKADGTPISANLATAAQYRSATADKVLAADKVWSAADLVTLTDGANIAVDMSAGFNFTVTLGGSRAMSNPTNTKSGQSGIILIKQDGTGSRTLTWGSNYKWPGGTAPTLTTTASRTDKVFYFVESSTIIHCSCEKDSR